MAHFPFVPRAHKPDGHQVHLRQPEQHEVPLIEEQPMRYIALALIRLKEQLDTLANKAIDQGRPFDQYNVQEVGVAQAIGQITLSPSYEVEERVESIIITGPAAATVTLQLGDRIWSLIIPSTGMFEVDGIAVILGRDDIRQMTMGTPGQFSLELMGHADSRGQLV